MGKKLIIAEKPSVANDIGRALGGFTRHGDYQESEHYVLSSAVGHLLELKCPESYEVKRGKWSFANLPIIPPHFELSPIEKTTPRLKQLIKLIKRKDVDGIINACDAGREGELIFSYIVRYSKTSKPIERLWLQSMTQGAIREQINRLRSGKEMQGLANAAVCRSEADWLVGINGTRAMTAFNSKTGGFHLTTVGRVQTPTLAVIVRREKEINAFTGTDYWELDGSFQCVNGEYTGKWFDPQFKEVKSNPFARADRIWQQEKAQEIINQCSGQKVQVSEEQKAEKEWPSALFDLTSLQRYANSRSGYSARMTLSIAQALYEKHKVITYPRTDSRCLPEDYQTIVKNTLAAMTGGGDGKNSNNTTFELFAPFAHQILTNDWVKPNDNIFNNAEVHDHFAIIPTAQAPKSLSEVEAKLYDIIVRRFLAAFYPPAEYLVTRRISTSAGQPFKTEGKILQKPGWKVVNEKESKADKTHLPTLVAGEEPQLVKVELQAMRTKPPRRYSEATLLTAMERAGKSIEDKELRSAMAGRGLGTPATRAQIIENLIGEEYLLREGRELVPTAKAFSLITLLGGLGVHELTLPELTGEWEWKLERIQRGEFARKDFMQEISDMTQRIVELAKHYDNDTIPGDFGTLNSTCPRCGGEIHENYKKFQCQSCEYGFWKIIAGRQMEPAEIDELLSTGKLETLTGFRNKMRRPFSASLRLNEEKLPTFNFGNEDQTDEEEIDFSKLTRLGDCPKCQAGIYELGNGYVCEKGRSQEIKCDFRISKLILQQAIDQQQLVKILQGGQSDKLSGFVSNKTKRRFTARLQLEPGGKLGFVFEARKSGGAKRGANNKATA